ncbi:hypothetical protein [Chromobacterium amazonense]|uniref:LysR substrate-binding domain-containing protein n=1 Tax=Chromobacterium amazonense TaxID=1382803 RepID=A0ABU8V0W8_9NEIS|nr:hypothetical protein [Chromobacterium amazonense]MDQ4541615.1 hypothetical protein [Chromobacterium amazonense]
MKQAGSQASRFFYCLAVSWACAERVQLRECPFPLRRFGVAMAWHERSHGHPGLRWLRGELAGLMGVEV